MARIGLAARGLTFLPALLAAWRLPRADAEKAARRRERRSPRAVGAALGILLLLSGSSLPLLGLVFADEPAPVCCRDHCCCAGRATAPSDDRPCLRRGCGCGQPDAAVIAPPVQVEVVLSDVALVSPVGPPARVSRVSEPLPVTRAEEPFVPPPRRPLPA